jgi:hypothetical protein
LQGAGERESRSGAATKSERTEAPQIYCRLLNQYFAAA